VVIIRRAQFRNHSNELVNQGSYHVNAAAVRHYDYSNQFNDPYNNRPGPILHSQQCDNIKNGKCRQEPNKFVLVVLEAAN
jgi:hypothetical protein